MKRTKTLLHIAIALIVVLAVTVAYFAGRTAGIRRSVYDAGKADGIRHAIEDSVIYTVECYDPDDPYANARPDGTDQTIFIELDGERYEHGMYQG